MTTFNDLLFIGGPLQVERDDKRYEIIGEGQIVTFCSILALKVAIHNLILLSIL